MAVLGPARIRPREPIEGLKGAARLLALVLGAVTLVGCGDDSDERRSGEESPTSETAVEQVKVGDGTLFADPGAIRQFLNPHAEIGSNGDLVDYVLPGLTGSGADCVEDEINADEILDSPIAEGAASTADLVLTCVAPDEVGKIFGMYAVGFEEDGSSRYADLAACVVDGFSKLDRASLEEALTNVYIHRLDLAGPPTSRTAAAEEIETRTACSTTPEPPPEETEQAPENQRVVRWSFLSPGDCLVDLPSGRIEQVIVVNCTVPHRFEVVGGTFSTGADDPDTQCANLFANYTGRKLDQSKHQLEYLQGEPGSLSARLICLASPANGRRTTGSLR